MPEHRWILAIGASLLIVVGATAVFAKPLRLAAPQVFGLFCAEQICVEAAQDLRRAQDLVSAASEEVEGLTEQTLPSLNIVLCSTLRCYQNFGGDQERAISFPWLGTVVSGPDWHDHIVRHELIHWLQFERFGAVATMLHPMWFREGMAYSLSGAPDWDIPEHYQPVIARYRRWQGQRDVERLWNKQPEF